MQVFDYNKTARDCSNTDAMLAGSPASCFDLVRSVLGPNWMSLQSTVLPGIYSQCTVFCFRKLKYIILK